MKEEEKSEKNFRQKIKDTRCDKVKMVRKLCFSWTSINGHKNDNSGDTCIIYEPCLTTSGVGQLHEKVSKYHDECMKFLHTLPHTER